jgi:hypothetical protein
VNIRRHLELCCAVAASVILAGGFSACSRQAMPEPSVDVPGDTPPTEPEPGVATLPVVPGSAGDR